MRVIALRSFSGVVSMYKGEIRDIEAKDILDDLLSAGYVEPETKKRGKKNESK